MASDPFQTLRKSLKKLEKKGVLNNALRNAHGRKPAKDSMDFYNLLNRFCNVMETEMRSIPFTLGLPVMEESLHHYQQIKDAAESIGAIELGSAAIDLGSAITSASTQDASIQAASTRAASISYLEGNTDSADAIIHDAAIRSASIRNACTIRCDSIVGRIRQEYQKLRPSLDDFMELERQIIHLW